MLKSYRTLALVAVLLASAAGAELLPPPPPTVMPADLPMHSVLYEAAMETASKAMQPAELARALERRGLKVHEGRVHVEIVAPEGVEALPRVDLARFGAVVDRGFANRVDAWVPPSRLIEVARSLPPGFVMERANTPQPDQVVGEGPGTNVTNSIGYRNGNANGNGIRIAVIDVQYSNLTAARNNGDAPTAGNTVLVDYAASGAFESGGNHGTGCVEAAFDHAPGATWRLYRVDSVADLGTAVTDCINNGVDIISHSQSWYNLGWADNAGAACAAANQASNAGILFVTSAGNRALDHWQGNFNGGAGDANWHDWVNGDEVLSLVVPPATQAATFSLSWNTSGGTFNHDLYLYDATLSTVLASSTNSGNSFETVSWMNSGMSNATVHLAVRRVSGGVTEFELFGDNQSSNWEYAIAAGSATSPSNATGSLVLSVGAVPWGSYNQANGSTPIAAYSSRGPSNSGMSPIPDLVGPTDTNGFSYPAPGGFGGTSCATPNVAGVLADAWSDQTGFSGLAISWLAGEQARTWRDWGTPGVGSDNVYGAGPCRMVDFVANTRWVAKNYGNVTNLTTGPYYTILVGYNAVVTGGRLLVLGGGSYPENFTLNRVMTVESAGGQATIGQ